MSPADAGWAGALLAAISFAAPLYGQGTPAGTRITATATVTFEVDGQTFTVTADAEAPGSVMIVARVAGTDLEPPGVAGADPGLVILFRHSLRNLGNAPDTFGVGAASKQSWPVRIHRDWNSNGLLDGEDLPVSDHIPLGYGENAGLILAVEVPAGASRGSSDTLRLAASSRFDPTATDTVVDLLQVRDLGVVVILEKAVDRATATVGDFLTYTIRYRASGSGPATNLVITDPIPPGSRYVASTLQLNGVPLTDAAGDDPGSFDAGANRIAVVLPTVAPGETGVVSFQVRVGS